MIFVIVLVGIAFWMLVLLVHVYLKEPIKYKAQNVAQKMKLEK